MKNSTALEISTALSALLGLMDVSREFRVLKRCVGEGFAMPRHANAEAVFGKAKKGGV